MSAGQNVAPVVQSVGDNSPAIAGFPFNQRVPAAFAPTQEDLYRNLYSGYNNQVQQLGVGIGGNNLDMLKMALLFAVGAVLAKGLKR